MWSQKQHLSRVKIQQRATKKQAEAICDWVKSGKIQNITRSILQKRGRFQQGCYTYCLVNGCKHRLQMVMHCRWATIKDHRHLWQISHWFFLGEFNLKTKSQNFSRATNNTFNRSFFVGTKFFQNVDPMLREDWLWNCHSMPMLINLRKTLYLIWLKAMS